MKSFILNEKEVNLPETWEEVNFEKFLKFSEIIKGFEANEDETLGEYESVLENLKTNTKIISFWTGLTDEEVSYCDLDDVTGVISHLNFLNDEYDPKNISGFTIGSDDYILPTEFMQSSSFGRYVEAEQLELQSNMLEKGKLSILPRQIAILCKKEGESEGKIVDAIVDKRALQFRKLSMATVWDVGFFLTKLEQRLIFSSLIYQEEEMQTQNLQ